MSDPQGTTSADGHPRPVDVADAACPQCDAAVASTDRFCEACGHELMAGAPASAAPTEVVAAGPVVRCGSCGATEPPIDGYCSTCGAKAGDPRDHEVISYPGVGGVSDRGKRHHRNEDAMAVAVEPGVVFAVVCDGVSTTVDPQVASLAAVTAARAELVKGGRESPALDAAFDAARRSVLAVPFVPAVDLGPPSCTFLAAVITDGSVALATLGDCRSYWLDDLGATQLTTDDSWATEQVAAGALTPDEAYADQRAHMITRWLGQDADPEWRPALSIFNPPGSGRLILCSDGLWNYALHPRDLVAAAGREPDPVVLAERLTKFANDSGGADNITVVVIDLPLPKGDL